MSRRAASFADELEKLGGLASLLGRVGSLVARNPLRTAGLGFGAYTVGTATRDGYRSGADGPSGRQLAAGRDASGRIRASDAAYTNFHQLFPHKQSGKAVRALSKNYRPDMFPAVISKLKGK